MAEGPCEFCRRDIGDGHERGCPYWLGWSEAETGGETGRWLMAPVTVPIRLEVPHEKVRALADQIAKVGMRWHALGLEMDKLASLMATFTVESASQPPDTPQSGRQP